MAVTRGAIVRPDLDAVAGSREPEALLSQRHRRTGTVGTGTVGTGTVGTGTLGTGTLGTGTVAPNGLPICGTLRSDMNPLLRALAAVLLFAATAEGQGIPNEHLSGLKWRHIGPFRGGRTKSALGIPGRPNEFLIGVCNGGVWKTDDYGRTWLPIFDAQPTGSIGAIAVAASRPDTIYVGSGEGLHRPDLSTGDGLYKSTDGGKTWAHLGLRDGQQIPQIAVDPNNPDRLFIAVLGHPYGPNEERGIYRSTDGGKSYQKVLYLDADTGGIDVVLDPKDARTVYASLWEAREGPWENASFAGPGSGLYKSTDGGDHWKKLTKGLPDFATDGLGRIGIGLAPSQPSRIYLTVDARQNGGLYRSDDAGESFRKMTKDPRVTDRGSDFAEVKVHPTNPDIVFTADVVVWKSVNGGQDFAMLRGAPGGDDYQRIWIDPARPETMLIASDQGAVITVNGGRTFSSWYNQPTAQLFHVNADNAFPYRLCGGQQESGSACVSSRGQDGQITFRDWHPASVEEYGYAVPDPLEPDVVYGGKVSRYDRRTGQAQDVSPLPLRGGQYRTVRTAPLVFSPVDSKTLYFAANEVWRTADGGKQWARVSPDLTRKQWAPPPSIGKYRGGEDAKVTQRGVIYALAPSPLDQDTLWAGTDDGLIHVTRDGGKSWSDVTPKELGPWAKVSILDAGHFDANTAYAAINTLRLDDLRPLILRTHDGGKTWTKIAAGLPDDAPIAVVREDPVRKGLLFAGSERTVHVSFDDGDHWQPLRLNLPATSIRDLIVKEADLAIATHGRGFWILDDISPLRQLNAGVLAKPAWLFAPHAAFRVRWNTNTDTPLPPDEPAAANPPDGAILDYLLTSDSKAEVVLEVLDAQGALVRRHSSLDVIEPLHDEENIPSWWMRKPTRPSTAKGVHRFVWDLRHTAPPFPETGYPIAAVLGDTPREPRGAWAVPGDYKVRLTAGGQVLEQPLRVNLDPRVKTDAKDLADQLQLSLAVSSALTSCRQALDAAPALKARLGGQPDLLAQLEALEGLEQKGRRRRAGPDEQTLARASRQLAALFESLQAADVAPTTQLQEAVEKTVTLAAELVARWHAAAAKAR